MTDDTTIYHMMGRMEGKVDAFLSSQTRHEKTLEEHDKRLAALEAIRAQHTGMTRFVGFGWMAFAGTLTIFAEHIKAFLFR